MRTLGFIGIAVTLVLITVGFYKLFFSGDEVETPLTEEMIEKQTKRTSPEQIVLPQAPPQQKAATLTPKRFRPGKNTLQKEINPKTQTLLDEVRSLVADGNLDEAVDLLKNELELDPKNAHILAELGFIHGSLKNEPEVAKDYLQRALNEDPNHGQAAYELNSQFARLGQGTAAADYFRSLVNKNPNSPIANLGMGDALGRAGRHDAAEQYYQKAAKNTETAPQAYAQWAAGRFETGDIAGAIQVQDKAIESARKERQRRKEAGEPTEDADRVMTQGQLDKAFFHIQLAKPADCTQANDLIDQMRGDGIATENQIHAIQNEFDRKCSQ